MRPSDLEALGVMRPLGACSPGAIGPMPPLSGPGSRQQYFAWWVQVNANIDQLTKRLLNLAQILEQINKRLMKHGHVLMIKLFFAAIKLLQYIKIIA